MRGGEEEGGHWGWRPEGGSRVKGGKKKNELNWVVMWVAVINKGPCERGVGVGKCKSRCGVDSR